MEVEKYYWYKEHEEEIEAFFKNTFEEWFKEYISKLPDIKDVEKVDYNNFRKYERIKLDEYNYRRFS